MTTATSGAAPLGAARVAPELLDLDGLDLTDLARVCAVSLVSIAADLRHLVDRSASVEHAAAELLDRAGPLVDKLARSKLARLL